MATLREPPTWPATSRITFLSAVFLLCRADKEFVLPKNNIIVQWNLGEVNVWRHILHVVEVIFVSFHRWNPVLVIIELIWRNVKVCSLKLLSVKMLSEERLDDHWSWFTNEFGIVLIFLSQEALNIKRWKEFIVFGFARVKSAYSGWAVAIKIFWSCIHNKLDIGIVFWQLPILHVHAIHWIETNQRHGIHCFYFIKIRFHALKMFSSAKIQLWNDCFC